MPYGALADPLGSLAATAACLAPSCWYFCRCRQPTSHTITYRLPVSSPAESSLKLDGRVSY